MGIHQLRQGRLAVPFRQYHFVGRVTRAPDPLRGVHLRLPEPAGPGQAHGGNLAVFYPLRAPRDGDAAP